MELTDSVDKLPGVGPAVAKLLQRLKVRTISDLIHYYPRRYDDYSNVIPIAKLHPGSVTVRGVIKQITGRYVRRGLHITEAVASDETGSIRLVWFNQPYRASQFKKDSEYYFSGDYQLSNRRFSILNPASEQVSSFPVNTARIVPIYKETKGLTSHKIRSIIKATLPYIRDLPESLPDWMVDEQSLLSYSQSIEQIHFPASSDKLKQATKRLGFDEVVELTLAALLNKQTIKHDASLAIAFDKKLATTFVSKLPFELTDDQRRAVWQIYQDMQAVSPMNRLLEGDVGSGKTVVAAMSALMVLKQGLQVALMAPTEILARQHYQTIAKLLQPLGLDHTVGLLVGSQKGKEKSLMHQRIESGEVKFIIGTHALIAEKVTMHKLGLVIIDEQHRFGVDERKKLLAKAGHAPHTLIMTATPIPRSLALTLFGDLDISLLKSKPKNRKAIKTELVPPSSRPKIIDIIKKAVINGHQVYIVCPLVDESAVVPAVSAEKLYEQLHTRDLKGLRVGLLHGQMPSDDKERVMSEFANAKLDVLVCTTVIEVGVDVPNASIMMIESPERFGLAQLHQLRGRIGRSDIQSYCYVMMSDAHAPSQRLRAFTQTQDGFKLSEYDLHLRGPGAIYGTSQHGELDLTFTRLTDVKAISNAREYAQRFIDKGCKLVQYPVLNERVSKLRAVTNLN